ncbi:Hypothetical predicted protein [Xyrichtys novacula]|uniref:Uncharacterized protein n=1 Tax=Xyrichtys novacula TaxID=13765 RepID=A0AAV1FP53_XYRNO|nr:Hypothetical predicted protein [Xyrichtys novacula]
MDLNRDCAGRYSELKEEGEDEQMALGSRELLRLNQETDNWNQTCISVCADAITRIQQIKTSLTGYREPQNKALLQELKRT